MKRFDFDEFGKFLIRVALFIGLFFSCATYVSSLGVKTITSSKRIEPKMKLFVSNDNKIDTAFIYTQP